MSPDVLFMVGVFSAYEHRMDVISAQRIRHRDLLHTLLNFKRPPKQTQNTSRTLDGCIYVSTWYIYGLRLKLHTKNSTVNICHMIRNGYSPQRAYLIFCEVKRNQHVTYVF